MYKQSVFAISALILAACSAPEAVNVSGSSTVLPAVSLAADQFVAETGTTVVVNAGGSGSGFNQLGRRANGYWHDVARYHR